MLVPFPANCNIYLLKRGTKVVFQVIIYVDTFFCPTLRSLPPGSLVSPSCIGKAKVAKRSPKPQDRVRFLVPVPYSWRVGLLVTSRVS